MALAVGFFIFNSELVKGQRGNNTNEVVDAKYYAGMKWRSVGPSRGGRSTAITGVNSQPFTFYMGATGGGVWKTTDAGTTWDNISDGQIAAGSIGAIAVAPSDHNVVYVGTGSACPRGNVSAGIGMFKSTDAGQQWKFIGLPKAGQIGKIEVHPLNPEVLYVAALGNIFGPNPERGVYRSKDGGNSWERVLYISDSTGAIDLTMDYSNPRILYAAMWRAERKPWTLYDGGLDGGIYKSVDGGDTWNKLGGGLPKGLIGRIGLSVAQSNPQKVYAIIQTAKEEDGGVYRSDNAGSSWRKVNRDHKLRQRGWYYSHITADPTDENTVYVSNTGFYRSTDGGKSFDDRIPTPHGDNHGVWINPNNPNIMINCNDGGANVSLNAGRSWSTQRNQPTSEFYRVSVDNQYPYRLYAGQQDNTTISVSSKNPGGLTAFQDWFSVGGSECGDVAVDPRDPNIIYAGSYSGEITYSNRATGQVRQVTAYPHYTEGTEQRDLKYRWQWNFPIAISPHNPDEVYHTSNFVHRSTNQGQTWEIISPDLTKSIDAYHDIPGGPIQHDATGVEVYSSIFAFEISPQEAGVFWAGSDDGLIHISRDKGKSWQNITPKRMPKEGTVNKIELSTHQAGRAFAVIYRYRDNDFRPYIFRTNNYGQNWELITTGSNGIPNDHFVRAVAEDTKQKGLLYAGTEFGMYVSFNDGKSWQPLQLNLPHVPITDMEVVENDLAISTQGRSFWILDDLSPLQELAAGKIASNHLFTPRDTYRSNLGGFGGNNAFDPVPTGALINFYLDKVDTAGVVQVEILDSGGSLVRKYSTKPDKDERDGKLNARKGLNRLQWNLRHLGPELVPDLVSMVIRPSTPGPRAVPGKYQVKLSVGDWSDSKELTVLPDPRWKNISQNDYQKQYELALEITGLITESHDMIRNVRALKNQVNGMVGLAMKAGYSEEIKNQAEALTTRLTAVEDKLIQNKAESSQDAINYPRVFTNHIGRLYGVLNNSQDEPTGGVLERYEDLKVNFKAFQEELQKTIDEDLSAFNALLDSEKVPRLIVPHK